MMTPHRSVFALVALISAAHAAFAQTAKVYTAEDYRKAERWMSYNVEPLTQHAIAGATYLADGRVFYREPDIADTHYFIADAAARTIMPVFDNVKLAAAINAGAKQNYDPAQLLVNSLVIEANGGYALETNAGAFHCDAKLSHCRVEPPPAPLQAPAQPPNAQPPATATSTTQESGNAQMNQNKTAAGTAKKGSAVARDRAPFDLSPDKTTEAFIRNWNLWIRDERTGQERQLTTDGVQDFGYATDNAGWQHSDAPILVWSPDSKKIATFQQDQRKDGAMYLVPVTNRHPELQMWKYPLLGDKDVTMIEPLVIDLASARMTRLRMKPEFHRSTLCDDVSCRGGAGWDDVQFAPDGKHLAIVSSSRDHKDATLMEADTETGALRTVFHEHMPTYFESGIGKVNWRYLPESNEVLWFSQRSDWGQMYLYDLTTGKLKNQVTQGTGTVTQVLRVDSKSRVLYFIATGKEAGEDPYFNNYYRVGFDGKGQQLLTPEAADHLVKPSEDGKTFVDVYSTPQTPRVAVIRDGSGKVLLTLAHEDISRLLAAGWKPPMSITVPAQDGKTTLYGFLWKPTTFDAQKKYPVIDYVYPGPFTNSCGSRSFQAHGRDLLDDQALADLGFIVVCIDGMGTPFRSKSFQDAHAVSPAGLAEDTIPDVVSGIKALGAQYSWIDLGRVGIWGHSGGGNATVSAMFHFPDFFEVGIAESGNHDNREYEDDWDEKYGGLEVIGKDGKSNYDVQANQNFAANLKGHLLLAHGTMDDNVPMNNSLLVVNALIKANKDFDLIVFPNEPHHYGTGTPYMMRRRWDYFVRNLAGGVPPLNYQPKSYYDALSTLSLYKDE